MSTLKDPDARITANPDRQITHEFHFLSVSVGRITHGTSIRQTNPHGDGTLFSCDETGTNYGRGNGDYMMSHDIEDLVAVIDGRPEIVQEVRETDETLRWYLKERFMLLVQDALFIDALPGHLRGDAASQARVSLVLERLTATAGNI